MSAGIETEGRSRAGTSTIAGGKIQIVDLNAIQTRLGPKWPKMAALVHKYFETAIKSELSPGDNFCQRGELEYLITFPNVTLAEARLKCLAISQCVCERLFGKDGEELVIRSLTAPLDSFDFHDAEDRERAATFLENQGEESLCARGGENPNNPARRVLSLSLGDEYRHQLCAGQPAFVYRPFWDSQKLVLLSYLAQPLPETCPPYVRFHAPATAFPLEPAQCELDILCLRAAQARIQAVKNGGGRLLIAVPLHFTTLCRPRYWRSYCNAASSMPAENLVDLLFLLHGIDSGVPNVRLNQELPKLVSLTRRIFCLAEEVGQIQRQFHNTGVQAIGIAARAGEPERALIERLHRLHAATRTSGAETFLLGASRRSVVVNAIGAGIRYVEGPAMKAPTAEPRFAVAHNILDYYRLAAA
jgi:hypothetical protein